MKQPGEKAIVIYTRNCNSARAIPYIYSIIYIHIYTYIGPLRRERHLDET